MDDELSSSADGAAVLRPRARRVNTTNLRRGGRLQDSACPQGAISRRGAGADTEAVCTYTRK